LHTAVPEERIFERLGTGGLTRVLDDVLDQGRLARLATACGVTYRGIRTRSQKRERILSDLVDKAGKEADAWKSVLRALKKETAAAARAWSRLGPEERERRLSDEHLLQSPGELGLHLFLVVTSHNGPDDDSALRRLIALKDRPHDSPRSAPASAATTEKEVVRLKKRDAEIRKKLEHLEGQLAKARDTEKRLKTDLIGRKGELAESRMLAERLQRDLDKARRAAGSQVRDGSAAGLSALSGTVTKLAAQQKELTHVLRKIAESAPSAARDDGAAMARTLGELRDELAAIRKRGDTDLTAVRERLDGMRDEIRAVRSAPHGKAASKTLPAPTRRRGAPERVGAFIDVQNVYYAARQLKGKLDFDALLAAVVRGRRLIQATAYVVESKEIDQSGFIARLEQSGISVRRKNLKIRADGSMKGDWDMEMALDILDAAPKLHVVVLVSGDGDFTSVVERVKRMGPRVEVVGFPRNTAKSLVGAADRFLPLDRKFMIRTPEASTSEPRPTAGQPTLG
jgi:uncharacterized LabA/DUF88 family protein